MDTLKKNHGTYSRYELFVRLFRATFDTWDVGLKYARLSHRSIVFSLSLSARGTARKKDRSYGRICIIHTWVQDARSRERGRILFFSFTYFFPLLVPVYFASFNVIDTSFAILGRFASRRGPS